MDPCCGDLVLSAAPRSGSLSKSSTGASSKAGIAAAIIARRHPKACAIGPLKKKLSAPPTGTPSMNRASGRDRPCGGERSPNQLVAGGAQAAPPPAPPPRANHNREKDRAQAALP